MGFGQGWQSTALARIAALGLAFVAAASVHSCTSPFLEAHDRAVAFGQGQRKSEIGVCRTVLTVFRRQTEVAVEGVLGVEVDTPALEIRIELLLCLPVLRVELVQVVVRDVERADVPLGLYNPRCRSSMGWFSSRLHTRFTSRSGDMPARYSAKNCGCALMNEMML